jgi:hypothetical protein
LFDVPHGSRFSSLIFSYALVDLYIILTHVTPVQILVQRVIKPFQEGEKHPHSPVLIYVIWLCDFYVLFCLKLSCFKLSYGTELQDKNGLVWLDSKGWV